MNKYLILLGLVLVASLSFAQPANWMQAVEGRYSCMYDYNFRLLELIGPGCLIIDEGEYFSTINTYFECRECMLDNVYMMMNSAGCSRAPTNPALFRTQMSSFNSKSLLFKQYFLSKVRGCLKGTLGCECSNEEVYRALEELNSDYRLCVSGEGRPPYCREPEEGIEG